MSNFKVTKATSTRINNVDWDNLGFGLYFSDHMYISDYKNGAWNDGEILPYGPLH